jgi:predicted O-linked N-acetylglucosamine transferase (SPINDLY family)
MASRWSVGDNADWFAMQGAHRCRFAARMSDEAVPQGMLAHALERHRAGDHREARRLFEAVLGASPEHSTALHHLGILALQQGDTARASAMLRRAAVAEPANPGIHFNLGLALKALDDLDGAAASYARALTLDPDFADAHLNLGNIRRQQGRIDAARASYEQAIRLRPDGAAAHNNLGSVLQDLGRWQDAIDGHRRALTINPRHAGAHYNLGNALLGLGRPGEAFAAFRQATILDPGYREAHLKLAALLADQRQLAAALAAYEQALVLRPDDATVLDQVVYLRQVLCLWDELAERQAQLLDASDAGQIVRPFSLLSLPSSPVQQQVCARRWMRDVSAAPVPRRARSSEARITIGYLSSDFRDHPTAYLITAMLEQHDRRDFRIIGYSIGPIQDGRGRRRVIAACDDFVDLVALSDAEAAARIANDGIEILVDLNGHVGGARPGILAHRPAAVQVNWLGYPGTMGTALVDYVIVDRVIAPPTEPASFDEQLIRLPHSYQPNDPNRPITPERPTRGALGLPEAGVVLCCFNASYKIRPECFAIWMELLASAPDSVLWLLRHDDPTTLNLRAHAAAHGVDPARLVFAPSVDYPTHLARLPQADLFLDTWPYGAHTTGSDALWTGVPLLTCRGATFPSRVGASMLSALALPELIATTPVEYAALARRLLHDRERLQSLRERVTARRRDAPLFDPRRFARDLELAYAHMAARQRAGEPPVGTDIPDHGPI